MKVDKIGFLIIYVMPRLSLHGLDVVGAITLLWLSNAKIFCNFLSLRTTFLGRYKSYQFTPYSSPNDQYAPNLAELLLTAWFITNL